MRIFDGKTQVATHERVLARGCQSLILYHYLARIHRVAVVGGVTGAVGVEGVRVHAELARRAG